MSYAAAYNEDGYIEMVYEGILTFEDMSTGIVEELSLLRKYNCCHYLIDFRNAELQLSMAALYEIPVVVFNASERLGLQASILRRALIIDQKCYNKFKFFEMVSRNRAQTVHIFTDDRAAMDWLMEKPHSVSS